MILPLGDMIVLVLNTLYPTCNTPETTSHWAKTVTTVLQDLLADGSTAPLKHTQATPTLQPIAESHRSR